MNTYEKTYNLYKRYTEKGPNNGKYNGEFYHPAFSVVSGSGWIYTEKIDGMNMRLILKRNEFSGEPELDVRGKTDNAQIPGDLLSHIRDWFTLNKDAVDRVLSQDKGSGVTLYGEGYGPGIQKGGGDYRSDKAFILFDVARWHVIEGSNINQFYLSHDDMEGIACTLGVPVVPRVFDGDTLALAVQKVQNGFKSHLNSAKQAEGIIAVAPDLFYYNDGSIRRLKFKLKTKDFPVTANV